MSQSSTTRAWKPHLPALRSNSHKTEPEARKDLRSAHCAQHPSPAEPALPSRWPSAQGQVGLGRRRTPTENTPGSLCPGPPLGPRARGSRDGWAGAGLRPPVPGVPDSRRHLGAQDTERSGHRRALLQPLCAEPEQCVVLAGFTVQNPPSPARVLNVYINSHLNSKLEILFTRISVLPEERRKAHSRPNRAQAPPAGEGAAGTAGGVSPASAHGPGPAEPPLVRWARCPLRWASLAFALLGGVGVDPGEWPGHEAV